MYASAQHTHSHLYYYYRTVNTELKSLNKKEKEENPSGELPTQIENCSLCVRLHIIIIIIIAIGRESLNFYYKLPVNCVFVCLCAQLTPDQVVCLANARAEEKSTNEFQEEERKRSIYVCIV